jgi:nucleoside-diphosphate-sugar epimerase
MAQGRIRGTVFRPSGVCGPRDLRFLKLFKAIAAGRFVMIGSGETLYHMCYIDDLIDGILLCGTKEEAVGNVYIFAGNEAVTLNELVKAIAEVLGVRPPRLHVPFAPVYFAGLLCEWICKPLGLSPPLYRRRVNFFWTSRGFSIAKAQRELGFQPKVDLKTALQRTAEWYKEQGLL